MAATITPRESVQDIHEHIVDRAQVVLSKRYGGSPNLVGAEILEGSGSSVVLRLKLRPTPYLQERTVVVKYSPASDSHLDEANFLREVVAYQFTTSLPEEARPGPVLLAYDMEERLLIISDCGDVDTFAELMDRAEADQRCAVLRRLGRALGLLHAASANRERDFDVLFSRMMAKHGANRTDASYRDELLKTGVRSGVEFLRSNGIRIEPAVERCAAEAQRRLVSGQHRAFTPFDLTPDNIVYSQRPEFLDYEWAGFRDATFDVACVIAGFPQSVFSHRIADAEADLFIEAWRQEIRTLWPNVNNPDRLKVRIVTALVGWAVLSVWQLATNYLPEWAQERAQQGCSSGALTLPGQHVLVGMDDSAEIERLARQDIYETCEALIRYARRGDDPRFPAVVDFAEQLIDRFVGEQMVATLRLRDR